MLVAPRSRRRLRDLADDQLMHRVNQADPLAFEVMFDRHSGAAFSLAYRMCGRRTLAEDAVQEAFLSLWRRGGRFDATRGSVRSWLLGTVRNEAIDSFRHESAKTGRDVNDDEAVAAMPAPSRPSGRSNDATTRATSTTPSNSFPVSSDA